MMGTSMGPERHLLAKRGHGNLLCSASMSVYAMLPEIPSRLEYFLSITMPYILG